MPTGPAHFDCVVAKSFYLQWLGFRLSREHRPENGGTSIMEVSRDKAVLHLADHYGDGTPCAKFFIGIDDLDELPQEIMEQEIYDGHRSVWESSREIIFLGQLNSERQ